MKEIEKIIKKRRFGELLSSADVSTIYSYAMASDENLNEVLSEAKRIRIANFGDKIELYVPIYISNICQNDCIYCDFRKSNTKIGRKSLNEAEYRKEIEFLVKKGHRFIEIVAGEGNIDEYLKKIRITKSFLDDGSNSTIAVFPGVYSPEELKKLGVGSNFGHYMKSLRRVELVLCYN